MPVPRTCEPVTADNIHSSEASNLVFADSTVGSDRGVVVVCATGSHTEFGQVAHLTAHLKLEASTI
ncbi:hypothetical protein [Trichormus azollae]|uniref:hypothetical protein n=1 Tax=Trichormus azollae TaxID=1164 RepID=UPI00325EBAB5